ncbi:MAG: RNA-binding protein [Candidatus Aureabacteria bacterium]|nr:RNA-binding protein [Candidatus Auribacterota bacterium]
MKLYVGNISYNTDENMLSELFSQSGQVKEVKVITDRDTGRSKGFAFVEMENKEAGEKAINDLNGKEIDGRAIKVNEARPQEKRSFGGGGMGPRRGGRGDRHGGRF